MTESLRPNSHTRRYHAAVWDEPLVMEMGGRGRRGFIPPETEPEILADLVPDDVVPRELARTRLPNLPELSEFEVQRHYLHLAQETLGMLGVSLFGTCTMKYNPRVNELIAALPQVADAHPHQPDSTLRGVLEIIHAFEQILCELSGMNRFVFQAGGGADAAYTHACVTRAYHACRNELEQRREVITTIQSHPCNAATAAAAGFDVVTLMIDETGFPPLEALRAAVSERTAALMVGNPDDMGIYNPHIREWVDTVHNAGGLAFYDHANFNGVMSKLRAAELGFDACMFMLHKTFGAPKGGGGPAVGAYGCVEKLVPFLPGPQVVEVDGTVRLEPDGEHSIGRVREFLGNVPQIVRAYAWARAMGAEGISDASDLSVIANKYLETRLLRIRGVTRSNPAVDAHRLEMTRYSLGELTDATGVTVHDIQNRMVDFGIDAPWLSHEPWLVPEPITPEAGELWSQEDLDQWLEVLETVCDEAYAHPEIVKSAPHNQVVHQLDAARLGDPEYWATTWRAYRRKRGRAPSSAS
jgi:glycine dehydrogenase subunit 2